MENKPESYSSPSSEFDEATIDRAARAVALMESWDGWDTNAATPNGNTPEEQRVWCRDMAMAVLEAAVSPGLSLQPAGASRALELLQQYRNSSKFSTDHAAIKRTVALEDEIDAFLGSLDAIDSSKTASPGRGSPGPKR